MVGDSSNLVPLNDPQTDILAINERLLIASIKQQELAELALRAEQRLRDLVDGLDAVICELKIETGEPIFLSLRGNYFLERTLEEWSFTKNFLSEIIHPAERRIATDLFTSFFKAGRDFQYDFRALSPADQNIWMRNIVRIVHDPVAESDVLRCIIVDITEQRLTSLALEEAYVREQNIAESLQRSLLFMPPEDSYPGLLVNRLYEAASDDASVGGDFCDTFACDHGNVALILGDVMGHGLPAAVFTAEMKYVLRGFVREHVRPGRAMAQMNEYLCESYRLYREGLNDEGGDAPLCLTLAIVDTLTGECTASIAGMEPILILRADGTIDAVDTGGLLLGVSYGEIYEETSFIIGPSDSIVMVTDGVTETRQESNFLGFEGLAKLAQEGLALGSLEKIGQTILGGTIAFGGGKLRDDACILLARKE